VKFVFLDQTWQLDLPKLLRVLQSTQTPSIVFYVDFFRDCHGRFVDYERVMPRLSKACPFPIYVQADMYMGLGAMGGHVVSPFHQGKAASDIARRILAGAAVSQIPIVQESPNQYVFDYRQLERFGVSRGDLPPAR